MPLTPLEKQLRNALEDALPILEARVGRAIREKSSSHLTDYHRAAFDKAKAALAAAREKEMEK